MIIEDIILKQNSDTDCILQFIRQQLFPGYYGHSVNRKLAIRHKNETENKFPVIPPITSEKNIDHYIKEIKNDLKNQIERKSRIEDKAKSLLFIIAVSINSYDILLNLFN